MGGIRAFNTSTDEIGDWLEENGLKQYRGTMADLGFEELNQISTLTPELFMNGIQGKVALAHLGAFGTAVAKLRAANSVQQCQYFSLCFCF